MNWKKIWGYASKILYLILLIYSFDRGFALWFILGSTLWFCIFYHKQLYMTMKKWSDMMLMVYDGYVMQQQLKTVMKETLENERDTETPIDINGNEQSNMESSSSSTRE